jgi:hypothetical protein
MLITDGVPVRTSRTWSVRSGGEMIRRWTMPRAGYPAPLENGSSESPPCKIPCRF